MILLMSIYSPWIKVKLLRPSLTWKRAPLKSSLNSKSKAKSRPPTIFKNLLTLSLGYAVYLTPGHSKQAQAKKATQDWIWTNQSHPRKFNRKGKIPRGTKAKLRDIYQRLHGAIVQQEGVNQQPNKSAKKAKPVPFSKQYFHQKKLEKEGAMPKFGSYKYDGDKLHKKGVLISIDGYSEKQYYISLTPDSTK